MNDYSNFKSVIKQEQGNLDSNKVQTSNPLSMRTDVDSVALTEFSQETLRPKYDKDINDIIEVVRILNNMVPIRMPIYNFNIDEINGDRYYKPDGTLLLVREEDTDVIRDYYYAKTPIENVSIGRILEHDKNTGRLRTKIEPITRKGGRLKVSITIFDIKINERYTIIQLDEDGVVNNVSEFSGKGKSFKTLFRNPYSFKPVRYLEGKDSKEEGFEMVDCLFDSNGNVARIKRYNKKREISIDYTEDKKQITVKNKEI